MSEVKNKNCSNTASVFSSKLFSIIAATMLLLLIDGGIHDAPAPDDSRLPIVNNISKRSSASHALDPSSLNVNVTTVTAPASQTQQTQSYPLTLESHQQRLEALEKLAGIKNDPKRLSTTLESQQSRLYALEQLFGTNKDPQLTPLTLEGHHQRLEALEEAFANNPPATQQTSGTQDLINNGINPTETPYPMAVCNAFLVNGQNICTDNNVTAVVAALAVGLIAGIVAIVQTEINNKQNTDKQRENSNNLLTLLLLSQQKQQQCVPSLSNNYTCP